MHRSSTRIIDYEAELNQEQLKVVFAGDGPILVIAGAGSGKTRTLTYRVARLIEMGIDPGSILLATFTNKAAREMIARVENLIGVDTSRLWAGTFHHLANRILRRKANLLGYESSYVILDDDDATAVINAVISDLGTGTKWERFPKGRVIGDVISYAANTGEPIEKVIARKYPYLISMTAEILNVASRYKRRKKEANLMDFDDLLINWRELLNQYPEVSSEYGERFRHILVDEYQDTNVLQAQIVDLSAYRYRNLMVVGDDAQSIYSFRGADYSNILGFPDQYRDAQIFRLETNYRSTPEILHLANRSIDHNEVQFPKILKAVKRSGNRPEVVSILNTIQQANFIAQKIMDLVLDHVQMSQIAVLYRAHYHSMELQMELTRRGIPYEIRSGLRFFEQAHIKDVTSYLRILLNPSDEPAWKRVLGLYEKVGKKTAEKLWLYLLSSKDPVSAACRDGFLNTAPKSASAGLQRFQATLKSLAVLLEDSNPSDMIKAVMENGYRMILQESYTDADFREEDIIQLGNFSQKFNKLEDFLSELALLSNVAEQNDAARKDYDRQRIVLSTVHQAKGLEWAVVFLISCSDGLFPLARALKEPGGEEEERRLFYVASTRAKDRLYLCYPRLNYGRGSDMNPGPSRFIQELTSSMRKRSDCPYDHRNLCDKLSY
jgi:DNA helicase-2/ATP-dependent DNA helicase PcrA